MSENNQPANKIRYTFRIPKVRSVFKKAGNYSASGIKIYFRSLQLDVFTTWALFKKEIRSYLYNPASYISGVVFLIANYLLFFSGFFSAGQATVSQMFDYLPWLLMFLVAALTMSLYSSEIKQGTMEYLAAQPVSLFQIMIAKYLAVVWFAVSLLLLTLFIPLGINMYGNLDWGVVLGQYLAAIMLIKILAALGALTSTLLGNQIAAFLVSLLASFLLLVLGTELITSGISNLITPYLENLSVLSHYLSMSRGVIDLRDICYAAGILLLLFSLTYLALISIKYPTHHPILDSSRFVTIVLVLLLGGIVLFSDRIPGRIDLTEKGLYTISGATNEIVSSLPSQVNVNVYVSQELPPQFQPVLREIRSILAEYKRIGGSNLQVSYLYPEQDEQAATRAAEVGVQKVQFNVVGSSEVQLKTGYLGIELTTGEKVEVIPFVDNTDDIEYQLTSLVNKMTATDRKVVRFLATANQYDDETGYSALATELKNQFEVEQFSFEDDKTIPADTELLVIVGATGNLDEKQFNQIRSYYEQGGNVLLLLNSINASATEQQLVATPNESNIRELFAKYGVVVNKDLVFDLASNETVATSDGIFQSYVPYPLWTISLPGSDAAITQGIEGILTPWTSSIDIAQEPAANTKVTTLLQTSEYGGVQASDKLNINIQQNYPDTKEELGIQPTMVDITYNPGAENESHAIVAGNSEMFSDQYVEYKQNLGFGMSIIESLVQDSSLSEIKVKDRSAADLQLTSQSDINFLKFVPAGFSVFVLLATGTVLILKRRSVMKREYVIA